MEKQKNFRTDDFKTITTELNQNIKSFPAELQKKIFKFLEEIPHTSFFKPDGKPKKEWKIFYGKTWSDAEEAAREAAWDKRWDKARSEAWEAAHYAVWNIKRDEGWDSTLNFAFNDTVNAAGVAAQKITHLAVLKKAARRDALERAGEMKKGVARVAARTALRDAGWDASLVARCIMVSNLNFNDKDKYFAHAKARWRVWQKGYGLLCEIDNVLYVYAAEKSLKRDE